MFLGTHYNNALRNHINNAYILSHIYSYPPDINMSQLLLDPHWFQLKSRRGNKNSQLNWSRLFRGRIGLIKLTLNINYG